jgi:nucleotide-binding universal stress UspA family protein
MAKIVVGVDGSVDSQRALDWALREAVLRHAKVIAVHAWRLPAIGGAELVAPVIDPDELEESARAVLGESIDAAAREHPDVAVQQVVVCGSAAEALIELSHDADLVVVGSRGHGGFAGLLLGSVSQQCVHHASCPVVVIPRAR